MKFNTSAVILSVRDVQASMNYYREKLGFRDYFTFGDYGGMMIGDVEVHFAGPSIQSNRVTGESSVYIFCEGVDEYYHLLEATGAMIVDPIMSYPYGMRDFVVEDPDGNLLTFGQQIDTEGRLVYKDN